MDVNQMFTDEGWRVLGHVFFWLLVLSGAMQLVTWLMRGLTWLSGGPFTREKE